MAETKLKSQALDTTIVTTTGTQTLTNKDLTQSSWVTPSLQNSWADYSTTYNTIQYMKDSMGFVHLKGLCKSGTLPGTIFTLPVGFRPTRRQLFISMSNSTYGRCDVAADGQVIANNGNNAWFTIDGMTFLAEQ